MNNTYVFPYIFFRKEEPRTQVFFGNDILVDNDELPYTCQHDVFDDFRGQALQVDYHDSGIPHPSVHRPRNGRTIKSETRTTLGNVSSHPRPGNNKLKISASIKMIQSLTS